MSEERRDDEIIGRALSRAIETIDLNQTPYERSRLATAPARRSIFGLWQVATAAAAIVLALAIGSWLTRPTDGQPGVAASPTASVGAPTGPAATATPTPSPISSPAPTGLDHQRIYFARDSQPPISAHIDSTAIPPAPEPRIQLRLSSLLSATQLPPGSFSAFSSRTTIGLNSVRVNGETATVDFRVNGGDWGIRGSAQSLAAVQQLVYTATEEPGIRRVVLTQNGGNKVTIDQLVVDKPLAREDMFGYSSTGALGKDRGITWGGDDSVAHVGARLLSATSDGSRVVIKLEGRGPNGQAAKLPSFAAWLEQSDDQALTNGKYGLYVELQWNGGGNSNGAADLTIYDQTPLRTVTTNGNNVFRIELDDSRPWRAYVPSPSQLVIEIGGDPRATSDRIAVTAPKPGDIANSGADLTLTGSARVFEANVVWRVLDSTGKVVANGHFLTSLGSSAVWGTFNTKIAMPANVRGNLTLELFEASPKDGSAQGVVQIPLAVR
ncbi:MAG: hypothetical protein E6J13_06965 [Chloroflexi bacterium]|nr:MAG: hypothetical protein E6J13_06965 [Chloroflexota bacterium]